MTEELTQLPPFWKLSLKNQLGVWECHTIVWPRMPMPLREQKSMMAAQRFRDTLMSVFEEPLWTRVASGLVSFSHSTELQSLMMFAVIAEFWMVPPLRMLPTRK